MQIHTQVNLTEADTFTLTATEAADAVLAALGGDPAVDYAYVTIAKTGAGGVGVEPGPPPDLPPTA